MNNWRDLSYLRAGTPRQQAAWKAITQIQMTETLQAYDPVLAGTIPLQIDVVESDLDIICTSQNLDRFDIAVRAAYGKLERYQETRMLVSGQATSVIGFYANGFWFELFAQPVPVEQQNAYRHMEIEARLLSLAGEKAYRDIQLLKTNGMKTEPAFAHYFHLPGDDPYQALLDLELCSSEELQKLIRESQKKNQSPAR